MLVNILTLIFAAIFSGAAIYIYLVEHQARVKLDEKSMLQEWQFGIKRATVMQGSLAIITFLFACISYLLSDQLTWLIGGIVMIMNWPYTLLFIMPINKKLYSDHPEHISGEIKLLIKHWNKLHLVRTLLGMIATAIFVLSIL